MRFKKGLILLVFMPVFLFQFTHLISWIAATPISKIEFTSLKYNSIPVDAKTYIVNHGAAIFSEHGTISDEPVMFAFWLAVFIGSIIAFVGLGKYVQRKNT